MPNKICTITTQSHLYKTKALIASIKQFMEVDAYVLVIDGELPKTQEANFLKLNFLTSHIAKLLIKKYKSKPDKLRWALKSVLMNELLNTEYDNVIYLDNDIYFYASPKFLFEHLNKSHIILTPHYYQFHLKNDQQWFEANLTCGLYNAGFIASSFKGKDALNWLSNCCLYNIKKSLWRGLFDDQKYLDLLPVVFDNVEILKHKGCNIAGWNLENCKRILDINNQVIIAPDYPIVFIHFTPLFFRNIYNKRDLLLQSYQDTYEAHLKKLNPLFNTQVKIHYSDYLFLARYCIWRVIRIKERLF